MKLSMYFWFLCERFEWGSMRCVTEWWVIGHLTRVNISGRISDNLESRRLFGWRNRKEV
jgi:hypothetical protein